MARYRCLAPIYTPGGAYVEIGQIIADDGTGDVPIPTNFVPSPACDPLDASAVAKLTAANPPTGWGVLGYWGIRSQFTTLPLPALSAAWKSIIHN
jgi:hypothetical protein